MLLLEGYVSNFTCARYYSFCVKFCDFYVNQFLARETITRLSPQAICDKRLKKNDTRLVQADFICC
jgi:hypothetical protein